MQSISSSICIWFETCALRPKATPDAFMMKSLENCGSHLRCLGKNLYLNLFWGLISNLANFVTQTSPFLPKTKPTQIPTLKSSFATHTTKAKPADQIHVSINMPASIAKSNTQDLNAWNSPQMMNNMHQKIPTPVRPEILREFLNGYDTFLSNFLLTGFTSCFRLGCLSTPTSKPATNHGSINQHPEIVLNKIKRELKLGRISEPSPFPQFPNLVISPLGVVPKKIQGQFRLIHDFSYPDNNSCQFLHSSGE